MSLASHFKKKSVHRKPRTNLSIVSDKHRGEAEHCQLGIEFSPKNKDALKNGEMEESLSTTEKQEDRKNDREEGFGFNFNVGSSDAQKLEQKGGGSAKHDAPFTFDFTVEGRGKSSNSKSHKKRKNRRNKKKNKKILDETKAIDETESDGFDDVDTQAMHSFVNSIEALPRDECTLQTDTISPSLEREESSNQEIMSPQPTSSKKMDRLVHNTIRTPPGFTSKSIAARISESEPTSDSQPKPKSDITVSKTPGKKLLKKKKKKAASSQRQAQLKALEEKRTAQASRKVPRKKDAGMKLKFNTSDKGRAMVNHGSLLVHREKNKMNSKIEESETCDDDNGSSSPFSFGFNFNSLLQDL